MNILKYILFSISLSVFAQHSVEAKFIKKIELKTQILVGIDNFDAFYYLNNNTFFKNVNDNVTSYSNIQLGNITSSNVFNPLKINVFYRNFNTVVILDNRLAEIFKIDFNTLNSYRSISHISTGSDNTLWLFNQDTQQLEVYDYKNNVTRAKTLPIQTAVLDIKSNYNYCWLLTKDYLYVYNYFGTLITKIKNEGYTSIAENDENIILKKGNALFYLKKDTKTIIPIKTPNLLINQFLVTNETLYIYNNETLHQFQLKIN